MLIKQIVFFFLKCKQNNGLQSIIVVNIPTANLFIIKWDSSINMKDHFEMMFAAFKSVLREDAFDFKKTTVG